jgi:hypothetical protein
MSSATTLDELEAQISVLEKELAKLRRRRNGYMRVCTLPAEILAEVFLWLQHVPDAPNDARPWQTHDCTWVHAMLVCRRFRDVAVHAPTLWTLIDYTIQSPRWRKLFAKRSGDADLSLYTETTYDETYFARVRSARLPVLSNTERVFNEPAPRIRELQLMGCHDELELDEDAEPFFHFGKQFLGGKTSHIVSLTLQGSAITLHEAPLMPALRHLTISRIVLSNGASSLWHLLTCTPVLEDLDVSHILLLDEQFEPVDPAELVPLHEDPVNLPLVTRLNLENTPAELAALLRMISITSTMTAVRIIVRSPGGVDSSDEDTDDEASVESEPIPINDNHLFIFDQWMAAVPPHLRPHIHGTASFDAPYRARSGAELSFPSGNTSRAHFKLVVTCDIGTAVAPNRLLSGIECIRMYYHSDMFEEEESRNVFDSPPVQNLPNVVALGLIQYNAKTAEEQIFLRSWLSARQGRMQHVSFMGCHPCIHWLSHALEDEGLVPSTAWSDEIL